MVYQITEKEYYNALEVLPPAYLKDGLFQIGEPTSHDKNGQPTYATFIELGGEYFEMGVMTTEHAKILHDLRSIEPDAESDEYQAEQEFKSLSEHEQVQVMFMLDQYGGTTKLSEVLEWNYEDVEVYEVDSLEELGEYLINNGYYGEIPERLQYHIDYKSIGEDWDCSEFEYNGGIYFCSIN